MNVALKSILLEAQFIAYLLYYICLVFIMSGDLYTLSHFIFSESTTGRFLFYSHCASEVTVTPSNVPEVIGHDGYRRDLNRSL